MEKFPKVPHRLESDLRLLEQRDAVDGALSMAIITFMSSIGRHCCRLRGYGNHLFLKWKITSSSYS